MSCQTITKTSNSYASEYTYRTGKYVYCTGIIIARGLFTM